MLDGFVALGLFIIGILSVQSTFSPKFSRSLSWTMGLIFIVLSCVGWGLFQISGHGIDESVWYHLQYGLEKSGFEAFNHVYLSSGFALVMGASFVTFLTLKAPLSRWLNGHPLTKMPLWVGGVIWLLAMGMHPVVLGSIDFFMPKSAVIPAIEQYAPFEEMSLTMPSGKKPNLVWIYAESMERTYLDETLFPGLMPEIKALSQESLSFENIPQVFGTGWTIAGMVASQCGIPLVTTGGNGNSLGSVREFLPGVTCLGDILRQHGYHLSYMGGAFSQFAGKGKFYKSHGFHEVIGYEELRPMITDDADLNDWGIQDDALFGFVRDKLRTLYSSNQPFALFTINVGTHHPHGYMAKSCQEKNYGDGSNPMLNAVHCADYLIGNLVRDLRAMDPDNSTMIVVGSDHLAMPNTAFELLEKTKRSNLLLFNWPSRIAPKKSDRLGSTLSSGVTALHLLGFPVEKLAFGRNLLGKGKTLMEELPNFNDLLASWEKDLRGLWQLPPDPKRIIIAPDIESVIVGRHPYPFPLVIRQNKTEKDLRVIFEDPWTPLHDEISQSSVGVHAVWIDQCERIKKHTQSQDLGDGKWCLWDNAGPDSYVLDKASSMQL